MREDSILFGVAENEKSLENQGFGTISFVSSCDGGGCEIRTHAGLPPNGFQEVYQRIPFQLSSVQFRLKQFPKILILQGFSGLFGTDMN